MLTTRTLWQFWGSTELVEPKIDFEMPASTTLKEFVALNALVRPFEEILSQYPNVEIAQM